jgi:hypothetical protein
MVGATACGGKLHSESYRRKSPGAPTEIGDEVRAAVELLLRRGRMPAARDATIGALPQAEGLRRRGRGGAGHAPTVLCANRESVSQVATLAAGGGARSVRPPDAAHSLVRDIPRAAAVHYSQRAERTLPHAHCGDRWQSRELAASDVCTSVFG